MVEVVRGLVAQGNSADDILKALGQNVLQGALNRPDPLDEALEKMEKLRRLEGTRQQDNVIDLEWWKAKQEVDLEREKLREAREREREQHQARNQLLAGVVEALRGPAEGGHPAPGSAAPPAAAPPAAPAPSGGLHRYHCAACGNVFAMTELLPEVVCPRCRTPLRAQVPGVGPGAPPPAPAETGIPTPPAPAPGGEGIGVTGLDGLWGEADVLT